MRSELQRDVEVVDSLIRGGGGADPYEHAAWQRIRARLTPERVEFEVFSDPSYYDMWAVRPRGVRDFNNTLHFPGEQDARFAAQVIGNWMEGKLPTEADDNDHA